MSFPESGNFGLRTESVALVYLLPPMPSMSVLSNSLVNWLMNSWAKQNQELRWETTTMLRVKLWG
jgi:hypothetical protein